MKASAEAECASTSTLGAHSASRGGWDGGSVGSDETLTGPLLTQPRGGTGELARDLRVAVLADERRRLLRGLHLHGATDGRMRAADVGTAGAGVRRRSGGEPERAKTDHGTGGPCDNRFLEVDHNSLFSVLSSWSCRSCESRRMRFTTGLLSSPCNNNKPVANGYLSRLLMTDEIYLTSWLITY